MTPQAEPNAAFFEALERRRTQALVQRDLAEIERLHAPEYELITPSGTVFTRARYLEAIAREPFYAAWDIAGLRVQIAGQMAVIRYHATLTFPSGRQVNAWHTDTYEERSGQWQAVWSQATELRPPTKPVG